MLAVLLCGIIYAALGVKLLMDGEIMRLLSENEIANIPDTCDTVAERIQVLLTAQLAKTDSEWEQLLIANFTCHEEGCPIIQAWQQLKKEIGL